MCFFLPSPRKILALLLLLMIYRTPVFLSLRTQIASPFPLLLLPLPLLLLLLLLLQTIGRVPYLPLPLMGSPLAVKNQDTSRHRHLLVLPALHVSSLHIPRSHSMLVLVSLRPSARTSALRSAVLRRTTAI